jgi:hypothetical protein
MFVMFTIIIFAILSLWMSDTERKRPVALIVMGVLCITIGGRAIVLLSDPLNDRFIGALYASEESSTQESKDDKSENELPADGESPSISPLKDETTSISSATEPRELTIEPTARFRYLTTPRPEWLETEATTSDERFQVAVDSGLHVRKRTAQQTLRDEVKSAIDSYVNNYLESELASTLSGYSIDEGESGRTQTISLLLDGKSFEIAHERFDERVEFDYGIMNQSHVLITIDEETRHALDQRWTEVRAMSRLFQMGLGAGAVLLLLGTMFSYLRLDTATRGYYTGRLQIGAAAAILAVIAASVVCANRIPWM